MVLKLHGMAYLKQKHDDQEGCCSCPIAMEAFDKARVDFLPEDACFIKDRPELCIAELPCGHIFHALSILCHMAISGMRCPICRCVSLFSIVLLF